MNSTVAGHISLVLVFTRGVSLRTWDQLGSFEREVALYRRLQSQGVTVAFVTYGDQSEQRYQERIPGIQICCNRWNLPQRWYERLIPLLHGKVLQGCDVVKSNQTCGADIALAAARRWKKAFLARCGYMWSKNLIIEHGAHAKCSLESLAIEEKVFLAADRIAVTTHAMRSCLEHRFPALREKIAVIPNYVDTRFFLPVGSSDEERPLLCFVGRLEKEKNLLALIRAVAGLDLDLEIIGQGSLRDELACCAKTSRVRLVGMVPNHLLSKSFNRCTLFVLPSLYEGHPKALLEAMACGVPVLGTDVTGINEVISHGVNGWLCKPDAAAIRSAIVELLADVSLRKRLGKNAASYVREHLTLDRVVEYELESYREAILQRQGRP